MASQQSGQKFGLVRTEDSRFDVTRIARLLAEPLELPVADFVRVLSQQPGILAENLTEDIAKRCAAFAAQEGVQARVVPQSAVLEMPEILTLRSGRLDNEGFLYVVNPRRKGVVRWPDALWVDLVTVQELSKQGRAGVWVDLVEDEPLAVSRPLVAKYPLFFDLVSYKPWLLLRIPQEQFDFAATGLPTFEGSRDRLIALSAAIAERAAKAHLGPGMKWLDSGGPRHPHRVASHAIYSGFLRWQLTRLFLA
jgi:hypothetical protein